MLIYTHPPAPIEQATSLMSSGNLCCWGNKLYDGVSGASPWGCRHRPTPLAAHFHQLSAQRCFVSAQKQHWQQIQLLTGGQWSRCVHSGTLMTRLLVDWPDRNWGHWRRKQKVGVQWWHWYHCCSCQTALYFPLSAVISKVILHLGRSLVERRFRTNEAEHWPAYCRNVTVEGGSEWTCVTTSWNNLRSQTVLITSMSLHSTYNITSTQAFCNTAIIKDIP